MCAPTLVFKTGSVSHWDLGLLFWLMSVGPTLPPSSGIISGCHRAWLFMWVPGIKLRSSCVCDKNFMDWAVPPAFHNHFQCVDSQYLTQPLSLSNPECSWWQSSNSWTYIHLKSWRMESERERATRLPPSCSHLECILCLSHPVWIFFIEKWGNCGQNEGQWNFPACLAVSCQFGLFRVNFLYYFPKPLTFS